MLNENGIVIHAQQICAKITPPEKLKPSLLNQRLAGPEMFRRLTAAVDEQ